MLLDDLTKRSEYGYIGSSYFDTCPDRTTPDYPIMTLFVEEDIVINALYANLQDFAIDFSIKCVGNIWMVAVAFHNKADQTGFIKAAQVGKGFSINRAADVHLLLH